MKISPLSYFITLLLLFGSFFAFAQADSTVYKNLAEKTLGVTSSFKIDDNKAVLQVRLTDSTFGLIGLDNKMQVLWRNQFKGFGVAAGMFKGAVLAIADSVYYSKREADHTFRAFLIDPQSGKIILQKEIFRQHAKHEEPTASLFRNDGSDFSLIVRQADIKTQSLFYGHLRDSTEDLTIVNLNDKLEPVYLKPKFPDETFIAMTANGHGDFFMLTAPGGTTLLARRYESGTTEPSKPITLNCDTLNGHDLEKAANAITPSQEDRNVLYLALAHDNHNNDRELYMGKLDFSTNSAQSTNEVFTGKHTRAMENSFVQVSPQFEKPNIGSQKKDITVRYFQEHNGRLIVAASEFYIEKNMVTAAKLGVIGVGYTVSTYFEKALIINGYDQNLKQQFQQLMPVYYDGSGPATSCFAFHENTLKIISNNEGENASRFPAYGELDLTTGKWLNMVLLKGGEQYVADAHTIWFTNSFIVPFNRSPGIFSGKYDIDLFRYTF